MAQEAIKKDGQKSVAVIRTEFGNGSARRARRADLITAVIYGHGAMPIHSTVPEHQATRLSSRSVGGKAATTGSATSPADWAARTTTGFAWGSVGRRAARAQQTRVIKNF